MLTATAQHSTFILKPQHGGRPSTKVRLGPRAGFFSSAATGSIATIAAVRRWRWQSDLIMRLESRRGTRDTHIPLRQPESWAGTSLAKMCRSAATSAHYGATNRMLDYILAMCRRRRKDFFPASRVSDHALGLATGLSPRSAAGSECVAIVLTDFIVPCYDIVCRTACLQDGLPGHSGERRGDAPDWVPAGSLPSVPVMHATRIWARSRSLSVVGDLGPAPFPPGPSRPAPVRLFRRTAVYAEPVSNSIFVGSSSPALQGCSFAAGMLLGK